VTNYSALCGTLPSRSTTTEAYRKLRAFKPSSVADAPSEYLISRWDIWLRNQESFGSCVGQAIAGAVETQVGDTPRLSGVSIWREARRLQGEIEQIDEGTRVEWGIAAIEDRGYSDPWHPGEDHSEVEAGKGATVAGDDLADELAAYGTVSHSIEHRTIWGYGDALTSLLQAALLEDRGIVIATGLRDPFFELVADEVATLEHIGGDRNGHAMLLCGWRTESDGKLEFMIRNSWNGWGGATVAGQFRPGLFWCSSEAVNAMWEWHSLRVIKN